MHTLFIGDLHLSADRPDITQAFCDFLQHRLVDAEALYILGDLFEVWVGDDLAEPFTDKVAAELYAVSRRLPVYFMHGNRDFLLGKQFAAKAGLTLLPDPHIIHLYGQPTLLLHGDSLCTLDQDYQRFRRFRNRPWARWIFRHLPQRTRLNIASKLRRNSQYQNQLKSNLLMDVEPCAVETALDLSHCSLMIHGHTHKPAIHPQTQQRQRAVVGDWYQQGSVLVVSPQSLTLEVLAR